MARSSDKNSHRFKRKMANNLLKPYLFNFATQKAKRTYWRVLEGADVGALWSYVVEFDQDRPCDSRVMHTISLTNHDRPH